MRSPRLIALSLASALALGGCSLARTNSTNTITGKGAVGKIGNVVSDLSSDASSGNSTAICTSIFSSALRVQLNKVGKCTAIVTNQLATVSDTTLTISKYAIAKGGASAVAIVKATDDGKQRSYRLHLVKQAKGGWRISSLG